MTEQQYPATSVFSNHQQERLEIADSVYSFSRSYLIFEKKHTSLGVRLAADFVP